MKLKASNILGQEQIDLLISRGLNLVWFPKELESIGFVAQIDER